MLGLQERPAGDGLADSTVQAGGRLALVLLGIIAVFVIGVILHQLRTVLLPFAVALLLSNLFRPTVGYLKRKRIPTAVGLLVVLLAFATAIFLFGLIMYSTVDSFIQELPKYERRLEGMVQSVVNQAMALASRFDITIDSFDWREIIQFSSLTAAFTSGVGSFVSFLSYTFLVLLFMLFMLAEANEFGHRITEAFPAGRAQRIGRIIRNIDKQVRQYLLTKTLVSAITGAITALVLLIVGVDFPLLWGLLAFLLNFIPNIGSAVATILPVILAFLQFDSPVRPMIVLVALGVTQGTIGNIIEPKIMSFGLNMSAVVIIVSLIFWGWLWGVVGMLLAVPLTATVKIICENIDALKPVAILMSGPTREEQLAAT